MSRRNKRKPASPSASGPAVPSAPVAPAAAAAARSPWILGPTLDSLIFIGAPLLVMAAFLPLRGLFTSREIAIFLLAFFTFGHHFPTFLRAYGDRDLLQRFRYRFLLGPAAVFAAALWFDARQLHGLLVFVALWDIWHVLMQNYGFMRIYDSKAGAVRPMGSWLDWGLSITWYVALIAVSPHYSHNLLSRAYQVGLPVLSAETVQGVRTVLLGAGGLFALAWLGWHLNQWRRGEPVSGRKAALLAIFLGATWYLYVGLDDFLVGFTVWSAFHCIQYYGIVWAYSRNRVEKRGDVARFIRFLFQPSLALVALYLGLIFAYGSINYFASAVPHQLLQRLLIAFIVTSNAMHYYFDGFIWKIRDSKTRTDLNIADAASSHRPSVRDWAARATARMSPSDKGWAQAAALVGVLAVFVGLEQGRSADRLAAARSLAAAAPELGEARYNLGNALWSAGRLDEALAAYEAAAEKLPDSSKVYNNRGGVLYDQGKFAEAIPFYERALELHAGNEPAPLYSSASPLMPGDAASHDARPEIIEVNLARALARAQRPQEAIEHYRRALALDPSSAGAHGGLGLVLAQTGDVDEGIAELEAAIALDPGYSSARLNLAGILAYQGQDDIAAQHYRAVMSGGDAASREAAAAALARLGSFGQ